MNQNFEKSKRRYCIKNQSSNLEAKPWKKNQMCENRLKEKSKIYKYAD